MTNVVIIVPKVSTLNLLQGFFSTKSSTSTGEVVVEDTRVKRGKTAPPLASKAKVKGNQKLKDKGSDQIKRKSVSGGGKRLAKLATIELFDVGNKPVSVNISNYTISIVHVKQLPRFNLATADIVIDMKYDSLIGAAISGTILIQASKREVLAYNLSDILHFMQQALDIRHVADNYLAANFPLTINMSMDSLRSDIVSTVNQMLTNMGIVGRVMDESPFDVNLLSNFKSTGSVALEAEWLAKAKSDLQVT
jgi:hypothetical protein